MIYGCSLKFSGSTNEYEVQTFLDDTADRLIQERLPAVEQTYICF